LLIFLPPIYEDEILYGIISRYHYISGNLNYKDTIKEFFDSDTVIPTISFPSLLENIVNKLPNYLNYDSKFLINRCTLFPVYNPFLPDKRRKMIISEMKYHNGSKISNLLGVQAGHILEINKLKYCPLCSIDDYNKNGEVYYHRINQIEGVLVCNKHGCLTKEYKPEGDSSRLEFVRLEYEKLDLSVEYEKDSALEKYYINIARSYEYLLTNDLYSFNNEIVHNRYIKYLDQMGLVTTSNRVKQKELAIKFINFYGERLLKNLNCSIDQNSESNWLKDITRKQKKVVHPLRHILFINFLCRNIEDFFSKKVEYHPFGIGPWPCLNIASEHYKKNTIKKCILTSDYKSRRPVGTFKCTCGFTYSRKGPDEKYEDRYKMGRIKKFGHIWEQKLYKVINEKRNSINDLSNEFNCDPKTIIKYAKKLGVSEYLNTTVKIVDDSETINYIKQNNNYKQELLDYINNYPNMNRTDIRKTLSKQYIWLYRHDKEWLMDNLPTCCDMKNVDYKSNQRVNWQERDIQICNVIKEEYEDIIRSDKLIRITRSLIGKRTGFSSMIEKCIDKLPLTNQLLECICESIEAFQIRRLRNLCKELLENSHEIKKWEVIRKAGIGKKYIIKLDSIIENIIDEYNLN
jgi:hypothetical protein